MTTDKEALQKIFEAALRQADPEDSPAEPAKRAEEPPMRRMYCQTASLPATNVVESATAVSRPRRNVQQAYAAYTSPPTEENGQSQETEDAPDADSTAALYAETADEIGAILDEKLAAENRRRKLKLLLTSAVALAVIGGSAAWLIKNPERLETLKSVTHEIQAIGDTNQTADSYQKSLDKVNNHSSQIEQATAAMKLKEGIDAHLDNNMKPLRPSESKTTSP